MVDIFPIQYRVGIYNVTMLKNRSIVAILNQSVKEQKTEQKSIKKILQDNTIKLNVAESCSPI